MEDYLYNKTIEYLKSDIFKHLSTLKYLSEYRDEAEIKLMEAYPHWALLVSIPTKILNYDTVTYPNANRAIFINGTSDNLKHELLNTLPADNYLLRINEKLDLSFLQKQYKVLKGNVFTSYSCSTVENRFLDFLVSGNPIVTDEAINIIIKNDYTEFEVRKYFNNGALWFGLINDNKIKSICFVYQNYGNIWEVAGVRTLETERNKGYARIVVKSAVKHLLGRNMIPRYNVNDLNINSVNLALNLGMKPFLTIEHYLLNYV
jgi:GNAT acetyltransferase